MRVVTACLTPCCSVEITGNQIHVLILYNGTNCKEELLSNTAFLGVIVVDVQRHDREGLLAIMRLPTKSSFRDDTLHHPSRFSFSYHVLLANLDVVMIERGDPGVGEESIFVEEDSTHALVSHMEAVGQKVVVEVVDGFL